MKHRTLTEFIELIVYFKPNSGRLSGFEKKV